MTHAKSACNVAINQSKGDEAMIHLHWPKLKHRHFLSLHRFTLCLLIIVHLLKLLWRWSYVELNLNSENIFFEAMLMICMTFIAVFRHSKFFVTTCEAVQIFTFPIKFLITFFLRNWFLVAPQMNSPRFASFSHVYLGLHSINIYSHSNGVSMEVSM